MLMLLSGNPTLRTRGLEEDKEGQNSLQQSTLPPGVKGGALKKKSLFKGTTMKTAHTFL